MATEPNEPPSNGEVSVCEPEVNVSLLPDASGAIARGRLGQRRGRLQRRHLPAGLAGFHWASVGFPWVPLGFTGFDVPGAAVCFESLPGFVWKSCVFDGAWGWRGAAAVSENGIGFVWQNPLWRRLVFEFCGERARVGCIGGAGVGLAADSLREAGAWGSIPSSFCNEGEATAGEVGGK